MNLEEDVFSLQKHLIALLQPLEFNFDNYQKISS